MMTARMTEIRTRLAELKKIAEATGKEQATLYGELSVLRRQMDMELQTMAEGIIVWKVANEAKESTKVVLKAEKLVTEEAAKAEKKVVTTIRRFHCGTGKGGVGLSNHKAFRDGNFVAVCVHSNETKRRLLSVIRAMEVGDEIYLHKSGTGLTHKGVFKGTILYHKSMIPIEWNEAGWPTKVHEITTTSMTTELSDAWSFAEDDGTQSPVRLDKWKGDVVVFRVDEWEPLPTTEPGAGVRATMYQIKATSPGTGRNGSSWIKV